MDHCHQAWLSRTVTDRILARVNHKTIVDDVAGALRDKYVRVTVTDGCGDGGVDIIARRQDIAVLIQIKNWRRRMTAFESSEAVNKALHGYAPPGKFHIWIVSRQGYTFPESQMNWPAPVKLWKVDDLLRACKPRELPQRMPRDRHMRLRAMQEAGRCSS